MLGFANIKLLRHPLNWVIIFVMLLLWTFLFDLFHAQLTGRDPAQEAPSK